MNHGEIILGVDTHLDTHAGAVISATGQLLGTLSVTADSAGYLKLLTWARSLGALKRAGVEGTGTYGASLTRVLQGHEIEVLEVNRPDHAARAVLSGRATAIPKEQSGAVEAMRAILVARRSAAKARTQASNQLRALLVSAPQDIRERLLKTNTDECISLCARLRSLGPMKNTLTEIRCGHCRKKLAEGEFIRLAVKCPRCGTLNELTAKGVSPGTTNERHGAPHRFNGSYHARSENACTAR